MEIRLFNQIYLNLHKIEFTFKTLFCQQCNYVWYSTTNNIALV